MTEDTDPNKPQWPSMQDLNSRLRKVITSYQRNFKKEELKLAQKAKPMEPHAAAVEAINQQLGTNWDWHQLAMYLWKVERREKYEQVVKERERQRLENNQRKWSRREEQDFYRTISTFGIEYDRQKNRFDWNKFRAMSRLEKKFDDTMTEYYKAFVAMCKRVCCMKLSEEEECMEMYVEPLPEDKARRTLEKINLLSKIREEILPHAQLDERLRLCQVSADVPDWWVPGKHDKDLLVGVAKHGLGRTDFFILNDPELSFREIVHKNMASSVKTEASSNALKLERPEDILKLDRNEIVVKLEKGEGTLKIEKIGSTPLKVDTSSENISSVKPDRGDPPSDTVKMDSTEASNCVKPVESDIVKESTVDGATIEQTKETSAESNNNDSCIEKTDISLSFSETISESNCEPDKTKQGTDAQDQITADPCDTTEASKDIELSEMNKDEDVQGLKEPSLINELVSGGTEETQSNEIKTVKTEELTCVKVEKEAEDNHKIIEAKLETTSVKSESEKSFVKEETKPESSTSTDLSKSSGNTEVVDRFKAMFPELEVMQRLPEIDTTVVAEKQSTIAQLLQQSYQNPIKWPKDHALQVRLQHIVHCVEHKEWPVSRMFSAYSAGGGPGQTGDAELETSDTPTPPRSLSGVESSEIITITTDLASRSSHLAQQPAKRKRHIAIDVETERAKLHALLNSTNMQMSHMMKHSPATAWDDESLSEDSRRSTPVTPLQPPPAHQQSHQSTRVLSMPFDLKFHTNQAAPAHHTPKAHSPAPSTLIPGTTSTLTPIDLSASVPKSAHADSMRAGTSKDISSAMDEVQDFSMPNKNKQPQQTKSKLDDMLNKLMQRKNCPVPVEEPVVGKEKKRRKLDEIVLGLSAAKEQQVEPKKSQPSVSVTVTKSMAPSTKSPFLAQAEQHNLLLKQQQQLQQQLLQQQQAIKMAQPNSATAAHVQRKTYEAMIADISKVADFSAKISSYSHEAKVNKWLAEQTSMIPDQSLGADFLSTPRRRRPRVDPTLLDWKKLTGEENVSVINRMTGKKLTGNKAPQLKRLAQWLLENPMYDVDPKWAELVKERGNLPHDLQKRLPQSERKKGPGRPPLLSSPPGSQSSTTQASSLPPGNLSFPSLASAGLGGINPSALLSGLSLGGFDPKNNPLLLPFGGMPNMSALGGMSGLGNMGLTNSLFANLASLGLPSLAGLDPSSLSNPATSSPSTASDAKTAKSHKAENKITKAPVSSASSSLPTSLPFFFPNPSLLYTPLGLGGLNPFSLQPGSMTSAYDSLALLNGSLGVNTTQSRAHKNSTSTTSVSSGRATTVTSASTSQSKQQQLQQQHQRLPAQFLLPHDTHLLESLTRSSKPKQSKTSLYSREQEMKEALETLSKSSTELLPRILQEDKNPKRTREEAFPPAPALDLIASKRSPSPLPKKSKESPIPSPASKVPNFSSGIDLSNHVVPEERTKTPPPLPLPPDNPLPLTKNFSEETKSAILNDRPMSPEGNTQESTEPQERTEEERDLGDDEQCANDETSLPPLDTKDESGEGDGESGSNGGKGKKRRIKKSLDVGQRKMLRSSAGRAAAAAARAREDHSN